MGSDQAVEVRIRFVVELARRLHEYGTAAPRLEDVVNLVGARLGLGCNVLATPTSIVMSFTDRRRDDDMPEFTQVVRLSPGDVNLKKLCRVDAVADQVIAGAVDLAEGHRLLREIGTDRASPAMRLLMALSYGLSSASIAVILHTGWPGVLTSAAIGVLIGLVTLAALGRPNVAAASEAISALLATTVATVVAVHVVPIAVRSVVIASLIVLLPGMTLTTAVRELSSQHLISGTARMAGAMATLLKLAFGAVAATQLCKLAGIVPVGVPAAALPTWIEWLAVLAAACSFAVLFRSPWRYYPVVIGAVVLSYVCTQVGGTHVSPPFGVFLGGLVIGAASNAFARFWNRPGALVREPGIILLVPGSVGFRTLNFVFERDVLLGIDTAIVLVTLLVAIVAGLLFGDLLVPPRRSL
ncbi:MAG TPA: threonine/serine exporter family protein [Rhodanobacteraceae bacterium]|nr:threonine/serine exporter family protein [Rhodanobacteraceae bacterium]